MQYKKLFHCTLRAVHEQYFTIKLTQVALRSFECPLFMSDVGFNVAEVLKSFGLRFFYLPLMHSIYLKGEI